ncbi:hypothetical protein NP233_g2097 [Leucocoprinus birnbaumii]|uniref:ATPase inhibitor, mitochondrial n=1 Tax=Leucocoprinus birnbaumii TaxID=56174 RepID=A0AAD5VZH2_9AGAR|nr:hypothetical protein NP233_g2097 [Leucocoprinus birnbaumii]
MSSGATSQDSTWKQKEQAEEARYIHQKEQEQFAAIKAQMEKESRIREEMEKSKESVPNQDNDYEGGFGGQEDLEDRYATTSGDH